MLSGDQPSFASFAPGRELMLKIDDQRRTMLSRRQIALLGGAVLAAILAVAIGAAKRADAVVPGTNGKIGFTTNRDGDYEIFAMNVDGTGQTRLTKNKVADT